MTATLARNAPCHCGSGKKYKRCHGANIEEAAAVKGRWILPTVLSLLCVLAGGVVGYLKGPELGIGVGGGSLILLWIYLSLRDPPPPNTTSGDPAGLNFGR
jgi:hypothetical protein